MKIFAYCNDSYGLRVNEDLEIPIGRYTLTKNISQSISTDDLLFLKIFINNLTANNREIFAGIVSKVKNILFCETVNYLFEFTGNSQEMEMYICRKKLSKMTLELSKAVTLVDSSNALKEFNLNATVALFNSTGITSMIQTNVLTIERVFVRIDEKASTPSLMNSSGTNHLLKAVSYNKVLRYKSRFTFILNEKRVEIKESYKRNTPIDNVVESTWQKKINHLTNEMLQSQRKN